MAKLYAPLHGAWKVLAFSATAVFLIVLAEGCRVTHPALVAILVVLAKGGSMALPTLLALPTLTRLLIVLAKGGRSAYPTCMALLLVHTEA